MPHQHDLFQAVVFANLFPKLRRRYVREQHLRLLDLMTLEFLFGDLRGLQRPAQGAREDHSWLDSRLAGQPQHRSQLSLPFFDEVPLCVGLPRRSILRCAVPQDVDVHD